MDLNRELHQISPSPAPSSSRKWWSEETVAVVTGANRGIGFAVVKRLSEHGLTVVLTARNSVNGHRAADSLRRLGFRNIHFFTLDVSDPSSIDAFVSWLRTKFGAIDILVNNAAVSFNGIHENSVQHPETVLRTNFYGAKLLTEALLPLFRRSSSVSRVLNISSRLGSLDKLRNPSIRKTLEKETLTEKQIEETVIMFLEDVKKGTWKENGWPEVWPEYAVSKVALNAYSRVLARRYGGQRLSVNCFCPGFTRTSMTGGEGSHTADEAATAAVALVLLPPANLPTGKFYVGPSSGHKKIVSKL
ncbi:PREDICTED: (+)-neomenthol dehydrogenase [Tarenaya hassleriana]|uniref:(+)-neomenthol dehydrogenase n=1 Tax=Tarenaya hassleriana TaxID=28532 RepID=UPI00053C9A4E|nr:PREDICTED: (+)-neomenthol dehydrogenase [Tarenaya hassleriana]